MTTTQTLATAGRRSRPNGTPYLLAALGTAVLGVFFVVPLISGLAVSLMTGNPQEGYQLTWNWGIYSTLFVHPDVPYALFFLRSMIYGISATLVALIVGYAMAYYIAFRASARWKNALLMLVMVSFFVSFVIRTDMWSLVLANGGPVLSLLRHLHLVGSSFQILGSHGVVIFGLAYNDIAFMVLPIYAALERLDPRLHEAAGDLYASRFTTFFKITLPLSKSGIFAGILLVFIDCVGDPVNSALLGGSRTYTIGQAIQDAYMGNQQYNVAAALSTVLMIIVGILLFAYAKIAGTDNLEDLV